MLRDTRTKRVALLLFAFGVVVSCASLATKGWTALHLTRTRRHDSRLSVYRVDPKWAQSRAPGALVLGGGDGAAPRAPANYDSTQPRFARFRFRSSASSRLRRMPL